VSPSPTVNVPGTGAGNAQTVTVSESPYAAPKAFSHTDTCNPGAGLIATITPATVQGPSGNFTVTGSKAGTCTVTFFDVFSQQTTVSIVVTTSGFIIQGGHW
jgi:hypothetical protein